MYMVKLNEYDLKPGLGREVEIMPFPRSPSPNPSTSSVPSTHLASLSPSGVITILSGCRKIRK